MTHTVSHTVVQASRWGLLLALATLLLVPVIGPSVSGTQWLVVGGGSMSPTLHVGDIVMVEKHDTLRIGDVVTARRPDSSLVTHRIVKIAPDGAVVLRGDANTANDPQEVPPQDIIGTVTGSIARPWSAILGAATTLTGRLALAGAIVLLLLAPRGPDRRRSPASTR